MNNFETLDERFSRRIGGEWLRGNLERFSAQIIVGSMAQAAKGGLYKRNLGLRQYEPLTKEEMLAFNSDGKINGFDVRNAIRFKSQKSGKFFDLINVTVDVMRQNKIVTTSLSGLKVSVKEFIYAEDYKVIISGMLLNEKPNAYPIDDLKQFIDVLEDEGQIAVASVYLNTFGIDKLVLEKYDIPQSKNKYVNQQDFTLTFLSDNDVELEIS